MSVRVPFSKSTIFKIWPASFERSLRLHSHCSIFISINFLLMKTLPVHIAQFSSKYAMKMIGIHIAPAKLCCYSLLLIMPLLIVVIKAQMATLSAIVINSLLAKECAAFSNLSVLALTLKTDRFQNAPFSDISVCVFISGFEKLHFYNGAM